MNPLLKVASPANSWAVTTLIGTRTVILSMRRVVSRPSGAKGTMLARQKLYTPIRHTLSAYTVSMSRAPTGDVRITVAGPPIGQFLHSIRVVGHRSLRKVIDNAGRMR